MYCLICQRWVVGFRCGCGWSRIMYDYNFSHSNRNCSVVMPPMDDDPTQMARWVRVPENCLMVLDDKGVLD